MEGYQAYATKKMWHDTADEHFSCQLPLFFLETARKQVHHRLIARFVFI